MVGVISQISLWAFERTWSPILRFVRATLQSEMRFSGHLGIINMLK